MNRFWNKVEKTSNCWLWKAYLDKNGYGRFGLNKKVERAHRVSWFLTFGAFPDGWLLHKCNNPSCVKPSHLYVGSPQENTRDSIKNGTHIEKIKPIQKKEIILRYKKGDASLRQLASEYGVHHSNIHKLIRKAGMAKWHTHSTQSAGSQGV